MNGYAAMHPTIHLTSESALFERDMQTHTMALPGPTNLQAQGFLDYFFVHTGLRTISYTSKGGVP